MVFVFDPNAALLAGDYRVALVLNGVEIAEYPFSVTTELPATPTPAPTATPAPTPTPIPPPVPTTAVAVGCTFADRDGGGVSGRAPTATPATSAVDIDDVVVTTSVDPVTSEPTGPRVFVWEDDPESLVTLWVAVKVTDLANVRRAVDHRLPGRS